MVSVTSVMVIGALSVDKCSVVNEGKDIASRNEFMLTVHQWVVWYVGLVGDYKGLYSIS